MEYEVRYKFNDMDVTKSEMRKELDNFAEYLANKYDADIYKVRIEPTGD